MGLKFQEIVAAAKKTVDGIAAKCRGFYHHHFGKEEQAEPAKPAPDRSLDALYKQSQNRLDRACNALTGKAVSSNLGGPKREKKKVVTSKTYKPQLDRF